MGCRPGKWYKLKLQMIISWIIYIKHFNLYKVKIFARQHEQASSKFSMKWPNRNQTQLYLSTLTCILLICNHNTSFSWINHSLYLNLYPSFWKYCSRYNFFIWKKHTRIVVCKVVMKALLVVEQNMRASSEPQWCLPSQGTIIPCYLWEERSIAA